jgi:undecaprenyl-diphosphatase
MGERRALALRHAIALGLLQGPTELLPLSSSGHTTLVPWLAGWRYGELEPELRKSFEVALHAGSAAALLVRPPWRGWSWSLPERGAPQPLGTQLGFGLAAVIPPSLIGYSIGGKIERRLGTPATIAAGLLAGSGAMIAAELLARALGTRAAEDEGRSSRSVGDVDARDGLTLGVAQALALIPGVSRSGATLAGARARGFSRQDADRLSWTVGLPVIAGAVLLKGTRLARKGVPRGLRLPLAVGAGSAFLSTLASTKALGPGCRATLLPACVAYRAAFALLVIRRMRDNTPSTPPFPKK